MTDRDAKNQGAGDRETVNRDAGNQATGDRGAMDQDARDQNAGDQATGDRTLRDQELRDRAPDDRVIENRGAAEGFLPEELLPGDTQQQPQATWKDIAAMILAVLSIVGPILLLIGAVMAILLRIAGV